MLHHVEIYVSNLETSRAFYDFLLDQVGLLALSGVGERSCL